ncbi:MAG: hypothetical protein IPO86_12780 [Saprospiraceae bacterium]|nr:hypothetical protein [Saprospiraceae bacterium]
MPHNGFTHIVNEYLIEELCKMWSSEYKLITQSKIELVTLKDSCGFHYLYDCHQEYQDYSESIKSNKIKSDRVVAAFGFTKNSEVKRDIYRMKTIANQPGYDRGHFIAHSMGGNLDQNLFPQKSTFNRGHSSEGKLFRAIENFCTRNQGIFLFSRPIYNDLGWIPVYIEYGFLSETGDIFIYRFSNK